MFISSHLAPLAPSRRCFPSASARVGLLAARPFVPKTGARVPPRRGVTRRAPEPARAAREFQGSAESAPESHDERVGEPADARPSPATVSFEPLPDDTACVAWTDHMRWLFQRLDEAIGPLSPVALDPDLRTRTGPPEKHGLPRVENWVYTSPFARRVRFTYVDEGAEKQIFNAVVYPAPDATGLGAADPADASSGADAPDENENATHLGDCPLLGVDLLCLAKGKNILVGLDLQPLSQDSASLERYADDLKATRAHFADLGVATPSTRFYEDARFFSPAMLFARPDAPAMAAAAAARAAAAAGVESVPPQHQADVCAAEGDACGGVLVRERTLDAVKAYAEAFLALLDASPRASPRDAAEAAAADVASDAEVLEERQNVYDRSRNASEADAASSEPCRPSADARVSATEETSLGETAASAARADASLAAAEASERLGAVAAIGAGTLFGATTEGRRSRKKRHERVLSREETAAAQDAHDDWQRARDPAVSLFAGWFGKTWAERAAREVLFPRGRAVAEAKARFRV